MWKFLHALHINEHKVKPYKSYLKYSTQTHIKCAIYLHCSMSNNQIHQSQKCTSSVEWILLCLLSTFSHTHAHRSMAHTFFYHLVRGTESWMNEPNERNRRDKHTTLQYNVYSAHAINIYPNSHRIISPFDIDTKCWHGKQRSPNRKKEHTVHPTRFNLLFQWA